MKLARFSTGGELELGLVEGNGIVSITATLPFLGADMRQLIQRWPELRNEIAELPRRKESWIPLSHARLHAPIARPGKIFAIGLNYREHAEESSQSAPQQQIWLLKAATATNGPFDKIDLPKISAAVDYEGELVAVMAPAPRFLQRQNARTAVFGYCVGNDVTARDWQFRSQQWSLSKSFDTHAPFGPWIVTADEIEDPHSLSLKTYVNGELRQSANTGQQIYSLWEQIEHLSQAVTLEAGDLVFTGTPAGVGAAMKPRTFLKAGDVVRVEIDRIGMIEAQCDRLNDA